MQSRHMQFTFRPITLADLPLLHGWLSRTHVIEWWCEPQSLAETVEEYSTIVAGTPAHNCYLATLGDFGPIGFIQSYTPAAFHEEGWWLDEHDPGVRGIDQFLANANQINQGLGTILVRQFVASLFDEPSVTRIQTDPAPNNHRAIRCYEKAGFRAIGEIDTLDGRALLMYCDRSKHVATNNNE